MVGVQMIAGTFKITSGQATTGPATLALFNLPSLSRVRLSRMERLRFHRSSATELVAGHPQTECRWNDGGIYRRNPDKEWINTNVVVKINVSLATPVLYAMLHEDHGIIAYWNFPVRMFPLW